MKTAYRISCLLAFYVLIYLTQACNGDSAPKIEATKESTKTLRIVSLNGSITELLFELGLGEQIVGVDVTSTFPAACEKLPKLGHVRQLSPEGILALKPDLVLVDEKSAGAAALQTLAAANINIQRIPMGYSLDAPIEAAKRIASALELDKTAEIKRLQEKQVRHNDQLKALLAAQTAKPKVLFIYARGAKTLMVSGRNTPVASMIELAGAENALNDFEDFKALSPEALLKAQPDVILLFESGLESLADSTQNKDAMSGLLAIPGIAQTPAGKNKKIVSMDGQYLSGFGPRVAEAALELAKKIRG